MAESSSKPEMDTGKMDMEKVRKMDKAMEESTGVSSSSMLSTFIVSNLRKEFEKIGITLTSELQGNFINSINGSLETIQVAVASSVSTELPAEKSTLPPLAFQFSNPGNECVTMAMMINGKPEVIKNEQGRESTPALAGYIEGTGLVYGADLKGYKGPSEVWRCIDFWRAGLSKQSSESVNLKTFGIHNLPRQFFVSFLFRKLKLTAEAQWVGGDFCQVAILTVPMQVKSAQRRRLKEAAVLAGFKDVYLTSAEGLAAYYWLTEKTEEIKQNNYCDDTVIIDLFEHPVAYKRSFEMDGDGKRVVLVRAVLMLDLLSPRIKEEEMFGKMLQQQMHINQINGLIPIISERENFSSESYLGSNFAHRIVIVKEDDSDKFQCFAAKGAALLSEKPENIGRRVQNMLGSTIKINGDQKAIHPFTMLPDTCLSLSVTIKHDRAKYRVNQTGIRRPDEELIGCFAINGVKHGTELEVSYEWNWEGIWKLVGVSARRIDFSDDHDEGYKPVNWSWINGDEVGTDNFGCSSNEECKKLLMMVAPSPSQPKVAKVASNVVTQAGSSRDLLNSLEKPGCSGSAIIAGHQIGIQKKKTKKSRSIPANEMVAKEVGLKKVEDKKAEGKAGVKENIANVKSELRKKWKAKKKVLKKGSKQKLLKEDELNE